MFIDEYLHIHTEYYFATYAISTMTKTMVQITLNSDKRFSSWPTLFLS